MYKIPSFKIYFDDAEKNAALAVMDTNWWVMGPRTQEFEERFAEFVGVKHAVAVNSGSSALEVAWRALAAFEELTPSVVSSAITFVSPIQILNDLGSEVVYYDVDARGGYLLPDVYDSVFGIKELAIMPMHFGGQPCDVREIRRLNPGATIVEDAAHAVGANKDGNMVGSCKYSTATCFSFHTVKTLGTPSGGMITTNDDELAAKCRSIRFFGIDRLPYDRQFAENIWEFDVKGWGTNYYMNDIAAAIAIEQLKKLPWMTHRRREIAAQYSAAFDGNGVDRIKYFEGESVHHLYVIRLKNRNEFIRQMKEAGIQCGVHYIPMYHYTQWNEKREIWAAQLPNTEKMFEEIVSLPMYPGMSDEDVKFVIENALRIRERYCL